MPKAPTPAYIATAFVALLLSGCASMGSSEQTGAGAFPQRGEASFYADRYQGRRTANGERFDQAKLTASHRSLAFGTRLRVTHLSSGRSVVVRINDRGPFVRGRVIDLSRAAFAQLADPKLGIVEVELELLESR